jgi:TonB family protein
LTRTSETRLAGRPGAKRETYGGYSNGDGRTNEIDLRPPSGFGSLATQPLKVGELAKSSAIEISNEGRFRSSESILKAVRSHAPGLRHLYNTYLKANPGMGGKVTVRFAISPSGLVVDAAVDRGTTGNPEFEEKVLAQIRSWRFEAIKAIGNDIVTVPFNFSE